MAKYAVIKTGGKQYRVQEGDLIRVELLTGSEGSSVAFPDVLMVGGVDAPKVGSPVVTGSAVQGTIVKHGKGKKVLHFHKNYFGFTRRRGHRQQFTEVKITGITA
jgi:large subunit ribosomal protein L21